MQGKIARVERLISVHIKESRDNYAGEPVFDTVLCSGRAAVSSSRCRFPVYQRQRSQKSDLLKKKVVELSRDINNTEISKCAAQHGALQQFAFSFLTISSSSNGNFEAAV